MRRGMKPLFSILVCLAMVGVGCGGNGGGGGGDGGGGGNGNGGGNGGTGDGQKEQAGSIRAINNPSGFVDGSPVSNGDPVWNESFVATNTSGRLDFELEVKIDWCRLFAASRVRVWPSATTAVRLREGTTWCSTDPDATLELHLLVPGGVLTMSDPVFGMQVVGEGSVVKVAQGFVDVVSVDGAGSAVLVGPGQQSSIAEGGAPQPLEGMTLDEEESEVVATMLAEVPPPDLGPPDPTQSPTMSRINEDGEIDVAIDEGQLQSGEDDFADSLLLDISNAWDLAPPDVFPTDLDTAIGLLDSGDVDLVLTPVPPDGSARVAGFVDPTGRLWSFVQLEDPAFADALGRTLSGLMNAGAYADAYRRTFESEPAYELLRPTLGF